MNPETEALIYFIIVEVILHILIIVLLSHGRQKKHEESPQD